MNRRLSRLAARDRRGATAVEFALLAPVFLGMMFFIIEGGRMLYIKQALREVAFATARCMSVSANCSNNGLRQNFARNRAGGYGVDVQASEVTASSNVTCDGNAGQNRIVITIDFRSPASGLLGVMPTTISGTACYPKLS